MCLRAYVGKVLILVIAGLLSGLTLRAQQTNVGGITGTVQDSGGAVVPGAQVVVTNTATGVTQSTVTSGKGAYFINALQIGMYSVTIDKAGFKAAVSHNVAVIAGQTSTANATLQVGSVSQTVDVSATVTGVATTDTQQGTTRTLEELQDLPINLEGTSSRAAVSSVETFSGVNFNKQQSAGQSWTIISRSIINGLSGGAFGYQIDGVEAGAGQSENGQDWLSPSPDQVAEVRVTNNSDATQGFNAGTTIGLVTKSGTNQFHGSVSYYNRNDALIARNWFLPVKAEDKQSEGGWTLGGPVRIPHVYDGRNKTFFFLSMDIFRYVTTATPPSTPAVNTVPTALMQSGNFTEFLGAKVGTDALGRPVYQGEIYDPATTRTLSNGTVVRDPFMVNGQLNVIPTSQLSSISKFFGGHYSAPTSSGVTNNWVGTSAPTQIDKDQWSLKIDQAIGQKHHLTFSVEHQFALFDSTPNCPYGGFASYGSAGYVDGVDAATARINCANEYRYIVSDVWTINPNLIFNFRAGVTRTPHRDVLPLGPEAAHAGCDSGLTGTLNCNTPRIGIENYSPIGPTSDLKLHSQKTPFSLSVSWSKRNHFLTFGVDYLTAPNIYGSLAGTYGSFSFNHLETSLPGSLASKTGAGIASFYLGDVHSGSVTSPVLGKFSTAEGALYAQDKWLVTNKLTLNLGLRWELTFPGKETHGRVSSFDPNLPNPGAGGKLGALAIGLPQIGDYYYKAFGPKIGLAYAFNPKTVFRANFGISYYPYWNKWLNSNGVAPSAEGFSQTKTLASLNNGVSGYFNWQSGFPYTFPTFPIKDPTLDNGGPISYLDPRFNRPPLVENIGAEVERELLGHTIVRVAYVGTMGHRIYAAYNLNQLPLKYLSLGSLLNQNINSTQAQAAGIAVPYPGFNGTVAQALTPYPQYTAVTNLEAQIGNSSYNSLQINVQRHFGSLTFLANATIAKYLTMSDNPGQGNVSATLKAQSYELASHAKSLGGYVPSTGGQSGDIPKQIGISWYWDLPLGRGKSFLGEINPVLNYLVGDWRVSAIQNYSSGQPLAITTNQTIPSLGSVWPVLNHGVPIKAVGGCGDIHSGSQPYLNSAAFSDPAPYTLGDTFILPSVRGCGFFNEDLGADKAFSLGGEKRKISFGATVTNLFNRHQFLNPNTNIDSPSFGTFTGTSFPRTVQLHGKIVF